jgi:5-formyltetrahydrofolate cyclo-ligase
MVQEAKRLRRKEILKKRGSLSEEEHTSRSKAILETLFSRPRLKEAKTIAFYLHKGSEVRTSEMIEKALSLGKEVVVPVTDHEIMFFRFSSFEDLQKGKYGILEPKSRTPPNRPPEVIIIPGIAFGLCMHRIGYGKGYYDKYLGTSFAYRVGICYDFQVMEKLPTHPNDQRMDEIITEKRIIS